MQKHKDFLSQLIGDPARARVLRTLIFSENEVYTAARIAKRAHLSTESAQRRLAALRTMGIVRSGRAFVAEAPVVPAPAGAKAKKGPAKAKKRTNEIVWFLDPSCPHLGALVAFVKAVSPVEHDEILETLKKSGKLSAVILSGCFVGDATRPTDILLAGDQMNERRLETAMRALEPVFGRELRYASFSVPEFRYRLTVQDRLIRDTLDFPHVVLMDRVRML